MPARSPTRGKLTPAAGDVIEVASTVTDPGELSGQAEALAATVAAGKTIGTNAPFVTINASGSLGGNAQSAGLGADEVTTLALDSGGDVMVRLDIQTADWAQVDAVDFYINNQPQRTSTANQAARYGVCADVTVNAGDANWTENTVVIDSLLAGASRTEISVELSLQGISEDSWLVAIAHGTDGISPPMFPIVPEDINKDSHTTLEDLTDDNLGEDGVLAYAFTNPLFIDVDGDGWTPPGVANAACP